MFNKLTLSVGAVFLLMCFASYVNAQEQPFPELHGNYLGLKPAADSATVFAKGIISTDSYEQPLLKSPTQGDF